MRIGIIRELSADGTRYVSAASDKRTNIPEPGLPFSLVFRTEPGKEDVLQGSAHLTKPHQNGVFRLRRSVQ